MLLDAAFLAKLEQLSFVARHVRAGRIRGERRSTKRGTSVEFADYRDYTRGDDLRRVDWNIYARLERPFVKLFEEEEDLAVHLLLDASASMDWGDDEENKWYHARRLAAALGYVALTSGDQLRTTAVRQAEWANFGPARGRAHTLRFMTWLEDLPASGPTDLNTELHRYALQGGRPGAVVLISDLFSPGGYLEGLNALAARGHEVALLHLLSPDEVDPPLRGDLRLLDTETEEAREVTIDGGVHDLYRRRLADWRVQVQTICRARGIHYVPLVSDAPFERVILTDLRRSRVLK